MSDLTKSFIAIAAAIGCTGVLLNSFVQSSLADPYMQSVYALAGVVSAIGGCLALIAYQHYDHKIKAAERKMTRELDAQLRNLVLEVGYMLGQRDEREKQKREASK